MEQIKEAVDPFANSLNKTIATTGMLIHNKLDRIEKATFDLGRADVGDKWFRINIQKELTEKVAVELAEVPMNEIWKIESITTDGITEKSPAFIVTIDGANLVFSAIKEGVGTETVGGDMVALMGETLEITARTTGKVRATIYITRRRLPVVAHPDITGEPGGLLEPYQTHDPKRDIIASETGQWIETGSEPIEVGN